MRKPVTLLDIAQTAGVSKATAARALSSRGYVAEEARRRVTEAARRLGYRPNVVARGFRSQRSFTIGHIAHAITENPFFAHVARSVEMEAIANGYKVFLYNQNGTSEHERAGVERFIERRVDAIILTYGVDVENLRLLKESGIPVVQIEREQTCDNPCCACRQPRWDGERHAPPPGIGPSSRRFYRRRPHTLSAFAKPRLLRRRGAA
jgi:DNA-binding LacI/PurR family transcriptional regulator